eukprot:TRINITY_DN2739_c0_g1_i1.p1 TRINITY_DN2739_c0_g1~~TRINITY_DN2739_c0_g1_i1.p1  ORF type:complete len:256 (-),score=27.06 TRINITY_DN2739_c0_g1_i1:3-770(-)
MMISDVSTLESSEPFDAILVLGGGPPDEQGILRPWVEVRAHLATKIYSKHQQTFPNNSEVIICLSGGTAHKPNYVDSEGYHVFEATLAADVIANSGLVPRDRIYKEWAFVSIYDHFVVNVTNIALLQSSYDTIGNAYFTRVMHTDIKNWRRLLILTSRFHMERSKAIFEWVFSLDPPSNPYQLFFYATEDVGLNPEDLTIRRQKEQQSVETLINKTIPRVRSLNQLHDFLFQEHQLYAVGLKPERASTKAILNSY